MNFHQVQNNCINKSVAKNIYLIPVINIQEDLNLI
jgi:hypothetical protein